MLSLIYGLTSGGMLILAFLILTNPRKVNQIGNRWLAFFLFTLFFLLIDESLFDNKVYNQYPQLIGLNSIFIFTTAPALYLSVSHYVSPSKRLRKVEFLHFLPTILFFPLVVVTFLQSTDEKLKSINEISPVELDSSSYWFSYLIWLQILIYLFLGFLKLNKHQKNINLFASNTTQINLNWLKYFLIGTTSMTIIWILDSIYSEKESYVFAALGYFAGTYFLGFFALRQEEIFPFKETDIAEIEEIIGETSTAATKQQRISETELMVLKEKLSYLMASEKLYLDETLNLPKLAEKMQLSVHDLSYLLNEGFGENFFQFVNKYRVEEAKNLLLSPKYEQLSMIGIAYESGFSSKTTFNTTFKKMTGISPSAFLSDYSKEKVSS